MHFVLFFLMNMFKGLEKIIPCDLCFRGKKFIEAI